MCLESRRSLPLFGDAFLEESLSGTTTEPIGNHSPSDCPHNCYRCEEKQANWVAISVTSNEEWVRSWAYSLTLCWIRLGIVLAEKFVNPRSIKALDKLD